MSGHKGSLHEGGTRVPLFIRWPARFKTPAHVSQIAAHVDLLPTLLESCGVPAPKTIQLDGRSLLRLLDNNSSNWPDRTLFTHYVPGGKTPAVFPGSARTQQYRLVNEGKGYELYDMLADPSEKTDLAKSKPDIVSQLSASYETWYRDLSRTPLSRPPIPVGYEQAPLVELPAPEARFEGGLRFYGKSGFAHDWITGWTNLAAKASWQLEVINSGNYELTLSYRCSKENAGSKIRVTVPDNSLEATLRATPMDQVEVHNLFDDGNPYLHPKWSKLKLGRLELNQGTATLTIQALTKPGPQVMDLKCISLRHLN